MHDRPATGSMKRSRSLPIPLPSGIYYGWAIVGVALAMNLAAASSNPVIFSFFIGPMGDDLGWSRSLLSLAFTWRVAAVAVASPAIGILVDRFGPRWFGALAGVLMGGCLVGLAFTHQLWYLYLLFAVSGASGFGGPGAALLTSVPVAKWFRARRGRALAIASVGMPAGTVLGIFMAQWLIDSAGWRQAWIGFGVVALILGVVPCALFMRRTPEDLGLRSDEFSDERPPSAKRRARPAPPPEVDWTVGQAVRTPALWMILVAMALFGLAVNGTLLHRISFWREVGMSSGTVAFGTALEPFSIIFTSLAFGIISERVQTRYLGLIAGGGFACAMLPMIFPTSHAYSIVIHSACIGVGGGAFQTVTNLIWPNYFGRKHLGTIQGITFPITVAASGVGAPLYGVLLDAGVAPTLMWTVSLALFSASALLLYGARQPRLVPRAAPSARA